MLERGSLVELSLIDLGLARKAQNVLDGPWYNSSFRSLPTFESVSLSAVTGSKEQNCRAGTLYKVMYNRSYILLIESFLPTSRRLIIHSVKFELYWLILKESQILNGVK